MVGSCFINVGANVGSGGFRAPIDDDGSFVYAPIPESDVTVDEPTYSDLGIDLSSIPEGKTDTVVHFDPEFPEYGPGKSYTYGDKGTKASRLRNELEAGDYLFFYATLEYPGDTPQTDWIHPYWGVYLIGHFKLAVDPIPDEELESSSSTVRDQVANNAHLRRSEFDADVLILGDPEESQLYNRAVPLSTPDTRPDDRYPRPNRLATRLVGSLDQNTNYGSAPWYRWVMVADETATDQLLEAVHGVQHGDDQALEDVTSSSESGLVGTAKDPEGQAFDQFMQNRDFSAPPQSIQQVQAMFEEEGWMPETEHALVASFAYIAGGWTPDVSQRLLNDLTITSLFGAKQAAEQGEMEDLERDGIYDRHSHRDRYGTTNAKKTPAAFESFYRNVTVEGTEIRSFTQFIDVLQDKRARLINEDRPEPEWREILFETAFDALEPVASFGDLTRFDWLEVLVRAHGFDWLAPTELKPEYLDTGSGPEEGLKLLFPIDGLHDDDIDRYLTLVEEYGQQFDIPDAAFIFTMESCLCQFQHRDRESIVELAKGTTTENTNGEHIC